MSIWYFLFYYSMIITLSQGDNLESIDKNFRLPRSVFPEMYNLTVITTLEKNNFIHTGSVTIYIRCKKSTNKITLHSRNLNIEKITLTIAETEKSLKVQKHNLENNYEFLHVYLENTLKVNILYKLTITFSGKIADELHGYYRSSYRDKSGKQIWLAATHFEPTNARSAFPCFDEPDLRAKFKIKLGHSKQLKSLSNMPLESTSEMTDMRKGWVIDTFEESVSMPTYVVAYMISDFEFESTFKDNKYGKTIIKIWANSNSMKQVQFAKNFTPRALSFFEEYFDIAYPLPKADLVALPDFDEGAMENWGLITFKETMLLYDPQVSINKKSVAEVVAHELAHMWFGNLVTMKWWDDTWLKEGFATYLAALSVGRLFPEWKDSFSNFHVENVMSVYNVDALEKTRPISVNITNPHLINEIFDAITYSKGSCVIRMMEHFLGANVLRKGLTHYLNQYKYSNAERNELWESISIVAHQENALSKQQSVKEIMNTWTTQSGYPLVTVLRDYTTGTVSISQQRYLKNIKKTDNSCFWVPLSYTMENDKDFNTTKPKNWLPCPKKTVTFKYNQPDSWIIFNIQQSGLYKVNYDSKNWNMLIRQLETDYTQIELLNRVELLDDVMELAMTGHVDYKIAFDLINYIRHDTDSLTRKIAFSKLSDIRFYLMRTPYYGLITAYMKNLVKPFYKILDNSKDSKYKKSITSQACKTDTEECQNNAVRMFSTWMKNSSNNPIPDHIRKTVYCEVLKKGDKTEWNFLWQAYLASHVPSEKSIILHILACTQEVWLLNRYLQWIIKKDSGIRHQDAELVFSSVALSPAGFYTARLFFYEHIQEIYDIQSPKGKQMNMYIEPLVKFLKTDREIEEFKLFVKKKKKYFKKVQLGVSQALEKLEILKQWYENQYYKVVEVLEQLSIKEVQKKPKTGEVIKIHGVINVEY